MNCTFYLVISLVVEWMIVMWLYCIVWVVPFCVAMDIARPLLCQMRAECFSLQMPLFLGCIHIIASFPGPQLFWLHEGESQHLVSKVMWSTYVSVRFERRLHFTGVFVSAVNLWHKRVGYKKCRFTTFTSLRIYSPTLKITFLPFYSLACAHDFRYQAPWRLWYSRRVMGLHGNKATVYTVGPTKLIDYFILYIYKYAWAQKQASRLRKGTTSSTIKFSS